MALTALSDGDQLAFPLEEAPEAALPDRLVRLGLPSGTVVTLTHNRTVLLSQLPGAGLRLHAGYAWAPDDVLRAIVVFLTPRVPRAARLAARRKFLSFPVERHAESHQRQRKERPVLEADRPSIERLTRLHEILNARHFAGALRTLPIRLSSRMQTRLGEFRADLQGGAVEITISRRHLRRDGWHSVTDTLLHEMIHQWQCETGQPLDHGIAFRRKAREVGVIAAATVPRHLLANSGSSRTID